MRSSKRLPQKGAAWLWSRRRLSPTGTQLSAVIRFLKNRIYPVFRAKLFRKSDLMLKKCRLRFENTKIAHFWPYSPYSEIRFCLNQLFVTSLLVTRVMTPTRPFTNSGWCSTSSHTHPSCGSTRRAWTRWAANSNFRWDQFQMRILTQFLLK